MLEMTLPVGAAPPLHVHDDLDDTWYILEGQMVVRCGDEELVVGAGHWVSMPRGVPHTFLVVGEREARILLVHDNASFRDFIRELGIPAETQIVPQPADPSVDGGDGTGRRCPRSQAHRSATQCRRGRRGAGEGALSLQTLLLLLKPRSQVLGTRLLGENRLLSIPPLGART